MNKIWCFIGLVLLTSCINSINGKIEYRKDDKTCELRIYEVVMDSSVTVTEKDIETKSVYIVNESIDKSYEFTIKAVQTTNDTIVIYNTEKILLSPGDEEWIGCTKYYIDDRKTKIATSYSCTGQRLIANKKDGSLSKVVELTIPVDL